MKKRKITFRIKVYSYVVTVIFDSRDIDFLKVVLIMVINFDLTNPALSQILEICLLCRVADVCLLFLDERHAANQFPAT